ncbi:MAG: D-glycero-alpha-D-manno-heptose-1,7-bisphosphate 7-phosphatase [Candidatus Micrarchaeia archaeon]
MKPALFIDRDGTINMDCPYCKSASEIKIYNDVYAPLAELCKNFYIIIVTNQSGIARGYFSENDLEAMHSKIKKLVARHGGRIDAVYYCPDLPKSESPCRKPNTGMIEKALRDFNFDIDLSKSFVIGNDDKDIEMARRLSIKSILVDRASTSSTAADRDSHSTAPAACPDFVAKDFKDVLEIIKRVFR